MGSSPENVRRLARALICALAFFPLANLLSACGAQVDRRFAAESYDEYTEPLTNAIIGTPSGVVAIGVDGGVVSPADAGASATDGGGSLVAKAPTTVDAGHAAAASPPPGFGFWNFDDCDPGSNFLVDSSGTNANAQHALGAACVTGIAGLGVQIRTAKDVVQVPDEPEFTVGPRVGVAAWVHPNTVNGNQPIVIKRLNNQTAFSLGIHNGNIEMSVVLTTGTTVISRAPIAPGVWTHVGGWFDGTFVFLFINGQQFGQVFGAGSLRNVFAPIRIGATTQTQHFDGVIDNVFVSTQADARDQIIAQSCVSQASTLAVNPVTSGPVPFGTTVHYDVAVSDNDVGSCPGRNYQAFLNFFDPNITATVNPSNQFQPATPGTTVHFGIDVTGSEDADVGVHLLPFQVIDFGTNFESLNGQLSYELVAPSCFVFTRRELMITNTSVVDDPVRTSPIAVAPAGSSATPGAWSFGRLMREAAPTAADAPAMTLQLFQNWLTDQTINGFIVAARPSMQQTLIDIWPKTATGELDLDQAPLRLQAIVNRIDLRNLAAGNAGEARFVFGVNSQFGFPQNFTVIVEYDLVAATRDDVSAWANLWHGLSSHPFPSEEYNVALESITRRITDHNAAPGRVNGSALDELRTNENVLSPFGRWELRSFNLSSSTGFFAETTVKETPDLAFNGTQTLADFVNQNAASIKAVVPGANGNTVPEQFAGASFLGGSVFNDLIAWNAPGIVDADARFHMSLNTCNGCHGPDTNTGFLMVAPRFPGSEASLSPFLTGTSAFDRFTGQVRTLNDLARRRQDLTGLVCTTDGGSPEGGDAGATPPGVDAAAAGD